MDVFYGNSISTWILYGICFFLIGILGYEILKFIIHTIKLLFKKTKK
jgi:hypothetical protein